MHPAPLHQELQHGHRENQHEQDPGHCRGHAHIGARVDERTLEQIADQCIGGVVRIELTAGHHVGLVKHLKRTDRGYHNHEEEFEKVNGQVLYDILLDRTDPNLVQMEMDLGWLIVTGNDPYKYFEKYPNRFPLWHLKDMDLTKKQSTEFGKGGVDIKKLVASGKKTGMKYYFVEQEEYSVSAFESLKSDYKYLNEL